MTNNSGQAAIADPWLWRAECADGSTLDEVDTLRPDGRSWADLEAYLAARATTLTRLILIPQRAHLATHVVAPRAGAQVILRRRRPVSVSATTGEEVGRGEPITILITTWPDMQRAAYTFLFADGSVVVSDELNAV